MQIRHTKTFSSSAKAQIVLTLWLLRLCRVSFASLLGHISRTGPEDR
jgi:hypothetical protein